jgi:hypothetical protein
VDKNGVMDYPAILDGLRRQQEALANFGTFAFHEPELGKILTEAARVCAECLVIPFAKICRYREEQNDLLVVAGCGWKAGVVGHPTSPCGGQAPNILLTHLKTGYIADG